jgi:hypothetical protein
MMSWPWRSRLEWVKSREEIFLVDWVWGLGWEGFF